MASNHAQQIVQKLWNDCIVLRDDGLSYDHCVEQVTTTTPKSLRLSFAS